MMSKLILSLCDLTGEWSRPYAKEGYHVLMVDIRHPRGVQQVTDHLSILGCDITKATFADQPYGVLAAPPCTCFCRVASRWWRQQDANGQTRSDVRIMRRCLRLCREATGWWALENPPGRHGKLVPELGPPSWQFQPWEYGDPWSKQTYIWGTAKKPAPQHTAVNPMRRTGLLSSDSSIERAATPPGFASAFSEANP